MSPPQKLLVSFAVIYQTLISSIPFNNKSDYEYVWIPEWVIPKYITVEYNLKLLTRNGRVLAECRTCIYGLPQLGHFSYMEIVKHLADDCYFPTGHTTGIFLQLT